jgi:hypothetical protein
MVNQLVGKEQQPRLIAQKSLQPPLLAYYLPPDPSIGADGVVTAVEDNGKTVQLWLAGLPAMVLEYYGSNSLLSLSASRAASSLFPSGWKGEGESDSSVPTAVPPAPLTPPPSQSASPSPNTPSSSSQPLQLQMRSKEGLTAKARIASNSAADNYSTGGVTPPIQVGQLVQEAIRVLPRHLGLTVALDVRLERIERVDATSAFANNPSVSSVVVAGEQPADYLFGKVQEEARGEDLDALGSRLSPDFQGGYGLFYLASDPIRDTVGEPGEAVKSAVNRLSQKLKTLLAAKLLRLTANEGSSRLGIRASLEMVAPQATLVMQRETLRADSVVWALADKKPDPKVMPRVAEGSIPTLAIGSRIQYRLENYSEKPVYFLLLGLDSRGSAIALYKIQSFQEAQQSQNEPPLKEAVLAPGETLILPQSLATSDFVVPGPVGLAEIQLICSRAPFTKAIAALESTGASKGEGERIGDLFNPLEVAQAVMEDLHKASAISTARTSSYTPDSTGTVSDTYALDVNAWATLSFIYQVV